MSLRIAMLAILGLCWGSILQAEEPASVSDEYRSLVPRRLLPLLHAPELHRELKLSEQQVSELELLFAEVDGPWFQSRIQPHEKQTVVLDGLEKQTNLWLAKNATTAQRKRLGQIERQAQGARMFLRDDVARELKLDAEQQSRFGDLARVTEAASAALQKALIGGQASEELRSKAIAAAKAEQDAIKTVLKPEQQQRLWKTLGEPLDLSKLSRIHPMAPEFVADGAWLNSSPLTLKVLRGKVVLVHFYAFQCHNCHANFEVYRRWHNQLRDKGVVVIGIQTPETSRERNLDEVKSAAEERKLTFPILVDLESANWKAWGNTMWPEGKPAADLKVPWIDDLVEILDHAASPEELLEHTRMAMYQDRIFAFTPKGELIQLPKGATPVDFAYAVHTDLGDRTVGAKVNGRVVPLRTILENGDQVEILASEAQHPQPSWLRFVVTGKARSGVRRFVRHKERDETVELGRKIYDEIVERLPAVLDKDALKQALKRLKMESSDELMIAIARKRVSDEQVMEALMPGSAGGDVAPRPASQRTAISIKGLTPGVAYHLAQCCHPIPGDRIVGLRREDEEIEVHVIGCDTLASGVDADWLDLAWGEGSDGGAARLAVILRDVPGALGTMASILGSKHANIVNLALVHRDGSFQTFHLDLEVHDLAHLHAIIAALRGADPVSSVERI